MKLSNTIAAATLLLSVSGYAQSTPVPAPFASARTVFLANGGAPEFIGLRSPSLMNVMYASMHAALTQSTYRLVSAPSDADLSMVISVENAFSGGSHSEPYIRLDIFDIKSHTLLWVLNEPVDYFGGEKTWRKSADKATALALRDLNFLAQGVLPGGTASVPSNASAKQGSK